MLATYVQADRRMRIVTPLGKDALLLVGLTGHEAVSQLYAFDLEVRADNRNDVPFDRLLGQPVVADVLLPSGHRRHFHGLCNRVTQGRRDQTFTAYHLQVVPPLWLLTKKSQSRIFQQVNVPAILKQVLTGLNVTFELRGTYHPRDYCVQYRESDFAFASRLMEEEGLFYFFKHTADGVQMVVADTPQSHPDLPEADTLIFDELKGGRRAEDRVFGWRKVQELRSGRVTLWDHCFELPHRHLQAGRTILESVPVGQVWHKQNLAGNHQLEQYDFPGGYAQRFDGVHKGGADRPVELGHIYEDNQRTATLRMQQEAVAGLFIEGQSDCRQLAAGYRFTLTRHFDADGPYVLTGVWHEARLSTDYRSGGQGEYKYENTFTCIPAAQPFRPERVTPRPTVHGTQTAVVVGPAGQEVFLDKYGRIKVQFHWDRQGKNDAGSSCWVRVSQPWAGKTWGAHFWPRVGQEVIVDFLEGDPDNPIVVGTVYNADQLPPYDPRQHGTRSGVKTRSSPGGGPANFNELCFEDKTGAEEIYFHAERDFNRVVENNDTLTVGSAAAPDGSQTIDVWKNRTEVVRTGDEVVAIAAGNRTHVVHQNDALVVECGDKTELIQAGSKVVQAETAIELRVGASVIRIDQAGITLSAPQIKIDGTISVETVAPLVKTDGILVGQSAVLSQTEALLLNGAGLLTSHQGVGLLHLGGALTLIGPPTPALEVASAAASIATAVAVPAAGAAATGTVDPLGVGLAAVGVAGVAGGLAAGRVAGKVATGLGKTPVQAGAGGDTAGTTAGVAGSLAGGGTVAIPPVIKVVDPPPQSELDANAGTTA
jgi:type VI secretion system secreted protein VgrG